MSRRVWSTAAALVVAAIAAVASYAHMRGLALEHGQGTVISTLLPVSVDGMLVVATLALGDGRRRRWSAWLAFTAGVSVSIVANVLAARPELVARCISAWPAVAFLLTVEVITRGGRRPAPDTVATSDTAPDMGVTSEVDTGERVRSLRAIHPDMTHKDIAARLGVSTRTVSRHLKVAAATA